MQAPSGPTTFLFTDIEGSTRLWEQEPQRMPQIVARHDALGRIAVEGHCGEVVKTMGDGMHAAFADPLDAVAAALELQQGIDELGRSYGLDLRVRCGMHLGVVERRDDDYFGSAVNRAARVAAAAHGGQVLLSEAVAAVVRDRLMPDVSLLDLGTVRLRDLASPEHVYQLAHPKLRRQFPPLRSMESTPNNLPQQITSFIGRERELGEAKQLLQRTRLLTLQGAGGIGKTRLSLQLAADVTDAYPDGVWFVELAGLADPRLVPLAVASVVGVKEQAGRSISEALVEHFASRRVLLVLDNCEHLVQACAELAKHLLQGAAQLKVLASSRERLHVSGEAVYPVPPLAVPDPGKALAPGALAQCEGVRLFTERATAVQPRFAIDERNAHAVAQICARLDGIPLALELAAARTATLGVEQIAARLDDRFRLLTTGDRTALPRQQTLRALIDWSYELLSPHERALLRRLAVFAGGWSLEAAEAVAPGEPIDASDVIDLLGALVEKSLVVMDAQGARYRLLETVQRYAQERLAKSGEEHDLRMRHLAYCVTLVETAHQELIGPRQGEWLARLALERENLLAAHACCDCVPEGAELGLRLVTALRRYWIFGGVLSLGHRVTLEALARPGAQNRTQARCHALFALGQLGCYMGRYAQAQAHLQESLDIARAIDDKKRIAGVLQPLAIACLGQGDTVAARRYLTDALALAQELGDKREIAAALNALAQVHRRQGELDVAQSLYTRCVDLARELGDSQSIAIGLLNLSMVSIGRGVAQPARAMLLEVLQIVAQTGSQQAGQSALEVCAGLATLREQWARAGRFYGAAEAQMQQMGLQRDPADEAFLSPRIGAARGRLGDAAFAAAEQAGRELSYDQAIAEANAWLRDEPS